MSYFSYVFEKQMVLYKDIILIKIILFGRNSYEFISLNSNITIDLIITSLQTYF